MCNSCGGCRGDTNQCVSCGGCRGNTNQCVIVVVVVGVTQIYV